MLTISLYSIIKTLQNQTDCLYKMIFVMYTKANIVMVEMLCTVIYHNSAYRFHYLFSTIVSYAILLVSCCLIPRQVVKTFN